MGNASLFDLMTSFRPHPEERTEGARLEGWAAHGSRRARRGQYVQAAPAIARSSP